MGLVPHPTYIEFPRGGEWEILLDYFPIEDVIDYQLRSLFSLYGRSLESYPGQRLPGSFEGGE